MMGKIKQITVGVGKTINIGNYESVRIDFQAVCEVGEDENARKCADDVWEFVEGEIYKKIVEIEDREHLTVKDN